MPTPDRSEIDWSYAAGLVDGEAYIGIKRVEWSRYRGDRQTIGYHARVVVRMTQHEAVDFLCELGDVTRTVHGAHAKRGRPLAQFSVTDAKAERFLRGLLPYLRVKRRNAEAVLELRALQADGRKHRTKVTGYRDFPNAAGTIRRVPNLSYSDEFIGECERLYWRCRELNARGIDE